MARNLVAFAFMLAGPWLVWLSYAHLVRPWLRGSVVELISLVLSFGIGVGGAMLIGPPISRLNVGYRLLALIGYAIVLAFCLPWIGLLSICTTGDCL